MRNVDLELRKIIGKHSRKKVEDGLEITAETSLIDDLGFDSILMIEMILDIEMDFEIAFDDEDLNFDVMVQYGALLVLVLDKIQGVKIEA